MCKRVQESDSVAKMILVFAAVDFFLSVVQPHCFVLFLTMACVSCKVAHGQRTFLYFCVADIEWRSCVCTVQKMLTFFCSRRASN